MPEQAARSTAGPRAIETRTGARNLREAASVSPPGPANRAAARQANRAAPGQRNLRAVPDYPRGSESGDMAAAPRRTVVIRGQVADRYSTLPRSSRSRRVSRSYDLRLRPDRAALWAVLLGLALVIAALVSAHM